MQLRRSPLILFTIAWINMPVSAATEIVLCRSGPTSLAGGTTITVTTNFPAQFSNDISRVPAYSGGYLNCTVSPSNVPSDGANVSVQASFTNFAIDNYAYSGTQQIAVYRLYVQPEGPPPAGEPYQVVVIGEASLSCSEWPVDDQGQVVRQQLANLPVVYTFGPPETLPNWSQYKIQLKPVPGDPSVFNGCVSLPLGGHTGELSGSLRYLLGNLGSAGSLSFALTPATVEYPASTFLACVTLLDFVPILEGVRGVNLATLNVRILEGGTSLFLGACPVVMDFPPFYAPTRPGSPVSVTPPESTTGDTSVTVVFDEVTTGGQTTVTASTSPSAPANFKFGTPPTYYDISTTAEYVGFVTICISFDPSTFRNPSRLKLFHYEDGEWVDCTTSRSESTICGVVSSLSPFAICEPASIPVEVDIKPGDDLNPINPKSPGTIPVAILGSANFDVADINPYSLSFAGLGVRVLPNGRIQCSFEDVNGDGYVDIVCQFVNDRSTWFPGMTSAALTGNLWDGTAVEGSDQIRLVP